jgi:K+/H+ antiporter YhaU regulatory subunit KhtT
MSNFKNKMLSISGELSREDELNSLNEDHKLITRNVELEARLQDAFAKIMREIQSFEYSLGGYMSFPYGKSNPSKIIEQARNNQLQYKKLKSIAYERMEELREVIDDVFCLEDEDENELANAKSAMTDTMATSSEPEEPSLDIEIGTKVKNELGDGSVYYSKKTGKKKKKRY